MDIASDWVSVIFTVAAVVIIFLFVHENEIMQENARRNTIISTEINFHNSHLFHFFLLTRKCTWYIESFSVGCCYYFIFILFSVFVRSSEIVHRSFLYIHTNTHLFFFLFFYFQFAGVSLVCSIKFSKHVLNDFSGRCEQLQWPILYYDASQENYIIYSYF